MKSWEIELLKNVLHWLSARFNDITVYVELVKKHLFVKIPDSNDTFCSCSRQPFIVIQSCHTLEDFFSIISLEDSINISDSIFQAVNHNTITKHSSEFI